MDSLSRVRPGLVACVSKPILLFSSQNLLSVNLVVIRINYCIVKEFVVSDVSLCHVEFAMMSVHCGP